MGPFLDATATALLMGQQQQQRCGGEEPSTITEERSLCRPEQRVVVERQLTYAGPGDFLLSSYV